MFTEEKPLPDLSNQGILDLISLLKEVFNYISTIKINNNLGQYIQYPKIPVVLSENIAKRLILAGAILPDLNPLAVTRGKNEADLLIVTADKRIKVEVKATGKNAFQNFGKKDITADYLVWIHFDTFMHGATDKVEVFIITSPERYFKMPCKISLQKCKEIVHDLQTLIFTMDEIMKVPCLE